MPPPVKRKCQAEGCTLICPGIKKLLYGESLVGLVSVGSVLNVSALSHFHFKSGKWVKKVVRPHPICHDVVIEVLKSDYGNWARKT